MWEIKLCKMYRVYCCLNIAIPARALKLDEKYRDPYGSVLPKEP